MGHLGVCQGHILKLGKVGHLGVCQGRSLKSGKVGHVGELVWNDGRKPLAL